MVPVIEEPPDVEYPGWPLRSISGALIVPPPVSVAPDGLFESTIVETPPLMFTEAPPFIVMAPGLVGSRTIIPFRSGVHIPRATALARTGIAPLPHRALKPRCW